MADKDWTKLYEYGHRATEGWHLCVQWKNGQASWIALKDMKNIFPVQTAEYTVRKGIDKHPSFSWWMPYVLRKKK